MTVRDNQIADCDERSKVSLAITYRREFLVRGCDKPLKRVRTAEPRGDWVRILWVLAIEVRSISFVVSGPHPIRLPVNSSYVEEFCRVDASTGRDRNGPRKDIAFTILKNEERQDEKCELLVLEL